MASTVDGGFPRPGRSIRFTARRAHRLTDGELVASVTTPPVFRNSVPSAAALYDFQARRFDENDTPAYFDDIEVPWGRGF